MNKQRITPLAVEKKTREDENADYWFLRTKGLTVRTTLEILEKAYKGRDISEKYAIEMVEHGCPVSVIAAQTGLSVDRIKQWVAGYNVLKWLVQEDKKGAEVKEILFKKHPYLNLLNQGLFEKDQEEKEKEVI